MSRPKNRKCVGLKQKMSMPKNIKMSRLKNKK